MDLEAGICHVKPEYRLADKTSPVGGESDPDPDPVNNQNGKRANPSDSVEDDSSEKVQKLDDSKKGRNRGQNKKRPIFRADRTQNICSSLLNGPNNAQCAYENCKFIHDVNLYLKMKPNDIGDKCYVYNTKGFCSRGVTCRFAKSHLDENFNNLKSDFYDENAPATTCNGILSDLQIRLRKREYDFSESFKLVEHFNQLRSKNRNENNTENKPIGCVIDEVVTERDVVKKRVDFHNKLVLSPLTTVGNLPFRRICKEFGADITCGEMACAVPIVKGLTQEWALTKRHECEDIFGVQLCGNTHQIIAQATQLIKENSKIDFVDLNVGCPIDLIYKQGGGSALMRRTNVLEVVTRACSTILNDIPFTVKIRTGIYADTKIAHELFPKLERWGASALTIHGRSREQRYTKKANWEYIEECASKVKIAVVGNGDIMNFEDYNEKKLIAPHVSSVMIGRGALIKPWVFKEIKEQKHWDPSSGERFEILKKYVNYGLEHWGSDTHGVENTRRFLLEWQSFFHRYIPFGILEHPPQKINHRPEKYYGRDEMETLLSSRNASDWVKISEMLLGPVPIGFTFLPKHKANSY